MPTRPRMKRKTRGKELMPSKELLLVRLHVSGLGLEPRWLLNRCFTKIKINIVKEVGFIMMYMMISNYN